MSTKSESDDAIFWKACSHFDAGEYFEAHEEWEELWHTASGPRHPYLQGLIQTAVGLHHAGNGNINGARKLFAGALSYLEKGKAAAVEVDVEKLRDHILDCELALQDKLKGTPADLPRFPLPLLKAPPKG